MARAMWKGAIQFGLVTIPVKLYLATESNSKISFNMLHKEDLARIQMKIWCPKDEEVIQRGDTVRGYEWAPGQYVVITDEDLESVPLKTVRSIEIEQFVKRDADDSATRFVEKAYYIEPDPIGRKAFALLKEVLAEQGLSAICKVVLKDREALAAIDPFGPAMLLSTLHWPDEIRDIKDLDIPAEEPTFKPAERRMAEQLVAAMTGEFNPAEYHDEYREALLKVIESKVEGKQTFTPQPVETGGNLVDLMAALEASVAATRKSRDAAAGGKPVSVKEARARSAARSAVDEAVGAAPSAAPKPRASTSKAAAAAAEEESERARPVRRRKSA